MSLCLIHLLEVKVITLYHKVKAVNTGDSEIEQRDEQKYEFKKAKERCGFYI